MKRTALTIVCLLLTGLLHSQTLSVINGDTLVCITIPQMDTISSRLIRLRELPALHTLLEAQNRQIQGCEALVKAGEVRNDTLKAQIADYSRLVFLKEEEKVLLAGLLKQQKKQTRRVKMLTSIIVAPISLVTGGIIGLFIAR